MNEPFDKDQASHRQAYVEKMKAKLDEWNADIDKLEARAASAREDVQIGVQRHLDELKAARADATRRLKELQDAGLDAWESVRHGAEAAWDDMAKAFREAADRFK